MYFHHVPLGVPLAAEVETCAGAVICKVCVSTYVQIYICVFVYMFVRDCL